MLSKKIEPEVKGYLTPDIKMNLLRRKIRDLNCLNGKFDLVSGDGIPLSESIMEGSDISVKLRPKKVVIPHPPCQRSVESISLCSFDLFGSDDSNDDDSDNMVVTEV